MAVHIDNGFMRKNESQEVEESLKRLGLRLKGNYKLHYCNETVIDILILTINSVSLCFVFSTVVNAAYRFYNSTTVISGRKDQSAVKKQVTKTLNVTADPEEKRRIIGDTFIKV